MRIGERLELCRHIRALQAYACCPALYLYIYILPSGLCQGGGAVIQFLAQVVTSLGAASLFRVPIQGHTGPSLFFYLLSKRVFGVVLGELERSLCVEVLVLA